MATTDTNDQVPELRRMLREALEVIDLTREAADGSLSASLDIRLRPSVMRRWRAMAEAMAAPTQLPPELADLPVLGRAIPEAGGGWVIRLSLMSKRLDGLRKAGWRVIPSGRLAVIVQPPSAQAAPVEEK